LSMISKISYSVKTEKLVEVQEEISKRGQCPSYDFLDLLSQISYKSDINVEKVKFLHKQYLDDKNTWASCTLSLILQHHLNTHTIDFKTRQKICALLNIPYTPNAIK